MGKCLIDETAVKRILVVIDGTPQAETALPEALTRARGCGAAIRLLCVLRPCLPLPRPSGRAGERQAYLYLETVAERLRSRGVRVETRVRRGPSLSTVRDEASRADLVVFAAPTAGRPASLLGRLRGQALAARAPSPVILVRPESDEEGVAARVRSFAVDAEAYGPLIQRGLGSRTLRLDRIVGSVGRAHELRADFLPDHAPGGDDRFVGIRRAMERGEPLPAIDLYKLGDNYYVLDGNHRVAAARVCGQEEIDARVIECLPAKDPDAQRVFLERLAFERATGLTRIEASVPGHYPRLRALIEAYGDESGLADLLEAARLWDQRVYRPLAARLREARLGCVFPGENTADLVVHLAEIRAREEDFLGRAVSWEEALRRTIVRQRRTYPIGLSAALRRAVWRVRGIADRPPTTPTGSSRQIDPAAGSGQSGRPPGPTDHQYVATSTPRGSR